MTIRNLRIFIAVSQEENITHAAERLNITQPTVTRAIQELESYYGIRLFERMKGRLRITETGREFYSRAIHIVDSFDEMEKVMKDYDRSGVLRVGASITLGNILLPRAMASFSEKNPQVKVKAMVSNGARLQQALLDNRIDFALIEGGEIDPLLVKEKIREDRLIPIIPPRDDSKGTEIPFRELMASPVLIRERGSASRTCLDLIFALHGIAPEPDMESASNSALIEAVHMGLGISFLPEDLVRRYIENGWVATLKVTDEGFRRENCLVWHRQKFLSVSAKGLMDEIREIASGA